MLRTSRLLLLAVIQTSVATPTMRMVLDVARFRPLPIL